MTDYKRGADRGNRLLTDKGLGRQTMGPAGPVTHIPLLVRVVAPDFVAGLIISEGRCTEAAPKLKWAIGREREDLRAYFRKRGWKASIVPPRARALPQ